MKPPARAEGLWAVRLPGDILQLYDHSRAERRAPAREENFPRPQPTLKPRERAMLPSPAELRELSDRIRQAAPKAQTEEMRVMLAGHASLLAAVADRLDRDHGADAAVRQANIERYTRLLAGALDESTRNTVEALLAQENATQEQRRGQIEAWRRRAAELRVTADNFPVPSAQEALRRAATDLDAMADDAEAVLTGKAQRPGEVAC